MIRYNNKKQSNILIYKHAGVGKSIPKIPNSKIIVKIHYINH